MNRPEIQFLIGGSDLEMLTIRRILTANGFAEGENITDLHLPWGAKLSDYKDFFNNNQTFVGIEVESTRELHLIAVNDYDYIPATIEMGASTEEIDDIRRRDKDAQDVTEEDERLGEKSIIEHRTTEKGITILKELTSRFASITDRLYPYSKLQIYNDYELICYSEGVKELSELSTELSKKLGVCSRGGDKGYWDFGEVTSVRNL